MYNELTKTDIAKMEEEIRRRKFDEVPVLLEKVKDARELGDLSENDEYRSAKRDLNRCRSRIRYLEGMIKTAVIISGESAQDAVGLFDEVEVYYEEDDESRVIRLVTTLRNDVLQGLISKDSPFGKALMGHKVGDRVIVRVNDDYSYPVVVKSIKKQKDDGNIPISSY